MDRKGIAFLAAALAAFLALQWISKTLYPTQPGYTNATPAGVVVGGTNPAAAVAANGQTIPQLNGVVPVTVPAAGTPGARPSRPEQLYTLTNGSARFFLTSHGGGLKRVELLGYQAHPNRKPIPGVTNGPLVLNHDLALPVLALKDNPGLDGDGEYLFQPEGKGFRAVKDLPGGLRITREFQPTTNEYLLHAVIRIENRSAQTLALPARDWSIGTATPMNSHDKGDSLGVDWFDGSSASPTLGWVPTPGFLCIPSSPRLDYSGGESNVVWGAVHNQFFTLTTVPGRPAQQMVARRVSLPAPTSEQLAADPRAVLQPIGVQTALRFAGTTVGAGQVLEERFTIYAGPKEYFGLSRLQPQLDQVMGYGWFGFFAKPLLLGMNFLHSSISLPYGWCIVVITFLIKALFWPLTSVSTRSMKLMAELGPQLQAIRDKYKDDPAKLNEKTLLFMRESGYNPVSGCLPMVVQIPVFIGFFTMIRSAIELRGASFLWCGDLSAADTLFTIPGLGFLPLIGVPGVGLPFNLMPLFYVASALWQTHLTPPSPQMDPMQQKMMRWLPLMFLALFYNYSAGLTLYWTVQNLLSILQTKLTKTNVPAAAQVIPAKAARPGRR
jgi:YidC/Oxa1 family membrane protein insertase